MKHLYDPYILMESAGDESSITLFEFGRFLTVTGLVGDDGHLSVEPGFHIDFRRITPPVQLNDELLKDSVIVEFLDKQHLILTQSVLPLEPVCFFNGSGPNLKLFAAAVACPDDYHFIRYYAGDRFLKEIGRLAAPPVVKFVQTPSPTAADMEMITWIVERHADSDIRSIVLYSHTEGNSWQAIVAPASGETNSVLVKFADLPGGKARLRVLATDGFSTTIIESAPFEVPIKGVRPSILGPAEGAIVPAESLTWFHGQAYDYEKQAAAPDELLWCSSQDGELGRGPVIATKLSPGLHEVTLKCCGSAVMIHIVAQPDRRSSTTLAECGTLS